MWVLARGRPPDPFVVPLSGGPSPSRRHGTLSAAHEPRTPMTDSGEFDGEPAAESRYPDKEEPVVGDDDKSRTISEAQH